MTDGGPDHASEIFGTYIFKQGFVIGDMGYASALSRLVLIIALVLSVIQILAFGARLSPNRKRFVQAHPSLNIFAPHLDARLG